MIYWKILFMFFKLIGLLPIAILKNRTVKSRGKKLFKCSVVGNIYNSVLLMALSGLMFYYSYIQDDIEKTPMLRRYTEPLISNISIYSSFLVVFITIAWFSFNQKVAVDIGNELYTIDSILSKFNNFYKEKLVVKRQKFIILFNITIWIIIRIVDFFGENLEFEILCLYITSITISYIVIQYVCVVMLMQGMLRTINLKFESLASNQGIFMIDDVKKILTVNRFTSLRDSCLKLYELSSKISRYYSLPILGCVAKIFCFIVIDLYYLIRPLVFGRAIVASPNGLASILWLCIDGICLFIMTHYVTKAQEDVRYQFLIRIIFFVKLQFHLDQKHW